MIRFSLCIQHQVLLWCSMPGDEQQYTKLCYLIQIIYDDIFMSEKKASVSFWSKQWAAAPGASQVCFKEEYI